MKIGHHRPDRRCFKCNNLGHLAHKCKSKSVNALTDGQRTYSKTKTDIVCWNCCKKVHIRRYCKDPLKEVGTVQKQEN